MTMKIWLVVRPDPCGYDEYDSFVCIAKNEQGARRTHPGGDYAWNGRKWHQKMSYGDTYDSTWPEPDALKVTLLGSAERDKEPGVFCASFNAG